MSEFYLQVTGNHYPAGLNFEAEVEDVWEDNYLFFISPLDKKTISNFHSCLSGIPVGKKYHWNQLKPQAVERNKN